MVIQPPGTAMTPIILASTSVYRKELLERLKIPFTQISPNYEEVPAAGEAPLEMVMRYAKGKAQAVLQSLDRASLVIGSDQVALLKNEPGDQLPDQILTKPMTHDRAFQQLNLCSGRTVHFHTALTLLNSATQSFQHSVDEYRVRIRHLEPTEIDSYLRKDTPYDCAGSFKAEGLGIALFAEMAGNDPTSLIGLPLISLVGMLRNEGINLLK